MVAGPALHPPAQEPERFLQNPANLGRRMREEQPNARLQILDLGEHLHAANLHIRGGLDPEEVGKPDEALVPVVGADARYIEHIDIARRQEVEFAEKSDSVAIQWWHIPIMAGKSDIHTGSSQMRV